MMDGNHDEREITWTKKPYTHHDSRQIKTDKNESPKRINYLQLFVGGLMSLFVSVCVVVSKTYMVCFCFVFLRLVHPMLPVSLDCQILIASSVFFNVVYFRSPRTNKTNMWFSKHLYK